MNTKKITKKMVLVGILLAMTLTQQGRVKATIADSIGNIEPPPGVEQQNAQFQKEQGTTKDDVAIFFFLSKFVVVANVLAGIWVIVNLTIASYDYIVSQGNDSAYQRVRDKITMSFIGLAILVIAYAAIAIISTIFFGDPSFVLKPKL